MNITNILKEVMTTRGYTQKYLATKLGFSTTSGVSEKLRRKEGMRIDTFIKFLNAMECDIIVKSRTSNDEWRITLDE